MEDLPGNDRHTKEGADTAEHKSDYPSSSETCGQRSNALILAFEVENVGRVACGIASKWCASCAAHIIVVLRDCQILLKIEWRFDHGGGKTAR